MQTRVLTYLPKPFLVVATVLSILILAVMVSQVAARYVLNSPILWAEELALFSYVWLVFIAGVYVTSEQSHVTVKLFDQQLPAKVRTVADGAVLLVVGATCLAFSVGSFSWLTSVAGGSSTALSLPSEIYYGVVWGSILLMGIFSLVQGVLLIAGRLPGPTTTEIDQSMEDGAGL